MRCSKAEWQLQLYIDQRLSLKQLRSLEAHIADCADCREELYILETLTGSFQAFPMVREPGEMHAQIMQRVAASAERPAITTAVANSQPRPYSPWRPTLAELLAAILLATVATLGSILEQPSLRAILPIANGHDSLSLTFLHVVHTLTSLDSNTLSLLLWIAGTILGICITLAFAGTEVRSRWFKAMMDRLPVR